MSISMRFRLRTLASILVVLALPAPATAAGRRSSEGDRLFAEAKFNQAATAYSASIRSNPKDVALRLGLIRTLLRIDYSRWRDAIREGRAAISLAPGNADAHGLLSLALMRGGQPDDAATEADRALALDPKSYYGLVAQGRVDNWNERKEDEKKALRRAIALRPEEPDAYPYLLEALDEKDHDEALKVIKAYVKLNPRGHPHDIVMDYYGSTIIRQKVDKPEKQVVYSTGSPFTENDLKAADEGNGKPVIFTVSIERHDDDIILPVTIDGVTFHLLFDTGAGDSISLNEEAVSRLNIQPVGRSISRGVSGKFTSHLYIASTMSVGAQTYHTIHIDSINKLGMADGLFGGANFKDSAVTVDFSQNTMTIARGKNAIAPPPAEDAHVMTVPFHDIDGYIYIPIRLGDRTQKEWGLLDTGAEGLGVLSLITARDLAKQENQDAYKELTVNEQLGVGTTESSFTALLFRFAIDLALIQNSGTPFFLEMNPIYGASMIDEQINRISDFQLSAIVGISYLTSARRVTFDYPHHLLTMEFVNQQ